MWYDLRHGVRGVVSIAGVLLMAAGTGTARSPARPLVLLHCAAAPEALCQAMIQALAQAAGPASPVIRRVEAGETRPPRPGDIGVTLVLGAHGPEHLAGHLEWREWGQAETAPHIGPVLGIDTIGTRLTPQSLASFAGDLIGSTPGIDGALNGAPRD